MVFERYIYKHGKKLGPYYYENVRSPDGKVKTIYVGTNPSNHPKHRIRRPLFFLILVLILILVLGSLLFFLQNRAYLIKKVSAEQPNFEVDQILLKVLIRSSEFIEKQTRVMNTGSESITISVDAVGLSDIIKIDSPSFTIKPGQTKIVSLNFSSFIEEQGIEQQPGIYVGKLIVKSEKASEEVPIVVEIETRNVLFDMNLNPVAIERRVKQGSDTTIEVRLFNLQSIESANVDVEYFAKDINGNTILTETETVVVKTQASFFKTISIPKNLNPGPYVFAAIVKFGNSIGTASYLFDVIGPEPESFVQFCKNNVLCLGLSLTTILLLFALTAYFYFFIGAYLYEKVTGVVTLPRKRKEKEEIERLEEVQPSNKLKKFYKVLDEAKEAIDNNDVSEVNEFYIEARDLYVDLADREKQEAYDKLMELYKQRNQLVEEKDLKGELRKKEKLRRQKVKGFFHKIGLYKTIEEKKQIGLQKEKDKQEKEKRNQEELKREEKSRKQRELEEKQKEKQRLAEERKAQLEARKKQLEEAKRLLEEQSKQQELKRKEEEERKKKELEAKKREEEQKKILEEKRQEELRREEELRKQRELEKKRGEEEKQRILEEKKKLEEERKRKKDQEKRQKELEKQKQQQIKVQKIELIKQIEAKLGKNKEVAEQLNSELRKLEAEKRLLSSNINESDAKIKGIEHEILGKSRHNEELNLQKSPLFEKHKKRIEEIAKKEETEKAARDSKIKELKEKLASKQNALMKNLEDELSKLSPSKRKATEKWKRLEIKAKLKIEEHNLQDELEKYESKAIDEKKEIEQNHKKALEEINNKQDELKKALNDLESGKQQISLEKRNAARKLSSKDREIEKIRLQLENITKEQEQLNAELLKLKSGLSKLRGFLSSLTLSYKEGIEKAGKEREEQRLRLEAEKKEQKELEKQRAEEEKRKQEDELKLKIATEEKEPKEKRAKWFESLFKKEKPEFELKEIEVKPIEKKPREKKEIQKSEAEELEEAIRKLGLFREVEEKKKGVKEALEERKPSIFGKLFKKTEKALIIEEEKLEKKAIGKSKNFEKFYRVLSEVKEAIEKDNIPKAKELYVKARKLYVNLANQEKQEVYDKLMELYNTMKNM